MYYGLIFIDCMDKDLKLIIDETINQFFNNTLKSTNDYIGDINNDSVRGEAVYDCFQSAHGNMRYGRDGWRYDRHTNSVIWSNGAESYNIELLNNWLEKRNIKNPRQFQTFYNYIDVFNKGQLQESKFRIYNETLCPDLWDEYFHFDPESRINLIRIAHDFYEKAKLPAQISDLYLMGSIANYNWNPGSDIDIHIMIDYTKLNIPLDTVNNVLRTISGNWNAEHNIIMKNHKVEMNFQNIAEKKPHVTGIYSLVQDKWIRTPQKQNVQLDKSVIQSMYQGMVKYINDTIQSGNQDQMKAVKEYIDSFRQYGLDNVGEMSYENVVFKILRSKGLIKKLKGYLTVIYDKEMSVNEGDAEDITVNTKNYSYLDPECIGPFIIFEDGGIVHYIVSNIDTGVVLYDDMPVNTLYSDDENETIDTHHDLIQLLKKIFGGFDHEQHWSNIAIHGRTWKIDDKIYVSFWCMDVTKRNIPNLLKTIYKTLFNQTGVKDLNRMFLLDDSDVGFVPFKDFHRKVPQSTIDIGKNRDAELKHQLHLMEPEEKKQALAAMGAKPKIPDIPDWQKKMAMGIDEANAEHIAVNDKHYGWCCDECVGPLILFSHDGKSHYVCSNSRNSTVYLDGELVTDNNIDTHGPLIRIANKHFPGSVPNRRDLKSSIQGRTWEINDKIYIAFWNYDITNVGIHDIFKLLQEAIFYQTGVRDTSQMFLCDSDDDVFVPFDDYNSSQYLTTVDVGRGDDNGENTIRRQLHLMDPEQKKQALQAMGVKPKVGDIPDWQKKMAMGIDEINKKDINQRHPYPSIPLNPDNSPDFSKMTLDNLKALQAKTARFWKQAKLNTDIEEINRSVELYKSVSNEIKRRMNYVNSPVSIKEKFQTDIPEDGSNYIIVGITFDNGLSESGVTITGNEGHASLKFDGGFRSGACWRYRSKDGILYISSNNSFKSEQEQQIRIVYLNILRYLKHRYGIIPNKSTADLGSYLSMGHQITESTVDKDIQTKYFTVKFGDPRVNKTSGVIFLGDIWFANALHIPLNYRTNPGKWIINRHDGAFDMGLEDVSTIYFNTPTDLLEYLDRWYESYKSKKDDNVNEGVGAGIPEDDRLHIPEHRWQIRSKDAPKTPKIIDNDINEMIQELVNEAVKKLKNESLMDERYGGSKLERGIWYHGTSSKRLPTIMSRGLDPNVSLKNKSWGSDPNVDAINLDKTSYGGIYVTQNLATATGSGWRIANREKSNTLLIIMELQPRSLVADEDDFASRLMHISGNMTGGYHASYPYMWEVYGAPDYHKEYAREHKLAWVDEAMDKLFYDMKIKDPRFKLEVKKLLLLRGYRAMLTRSVSYIKKSDSGRTDWWQFRKAFADIRGYRDYGEENKNIPEPPSSHEGEKQFRDFIDQMTRTFKHKARHQFTGSFSKTARSLEPIGFTGQNKILAIVEIVKGKTNQYNEDVKIIYGTLPEDFKKQWFDREGELRIVK